MLKRRSLILLALTCLTFVFQPRHDCQALAISVLAQEEVEERGGFTFPEWMVNTWWFRRHIEAAWVLQGGNVIDVVTGEIHKNVNVVIAGDQIRSIGRDPAPPSTQVIDISGKYVVPGLFDLHAHVLPPSKRFRNPLSAEQQLEALLDAGVTAIRLLPLLSETALKWSARINAGELLGPTVMAASVIFEKFPQRTSQGFLTAANAASWVRKEALMGVRWIKVYNQMDSESLQAIIQTANQHGLKVCGHAEGVPPMEASQLGMACIEHMISIPLSCLRDGVEQPAKRQDLGTRMAWRWENADPEKCEQLMETFLANRTAWVPTLVVSEQIMKTGEHDGRPVLSENYEERIQRAIQQAANWAVYLHRKGGLVGLGTDFPVDGVEPGKSVHREMEILVDWGKATPLEALQIATMSSAKILELEDVLGSVESGKLAHLLILDGNPLEDIANIRRVHLVIHDGRKHDPAK